MSNGIDKKALFKLKSEPYLKPISDLGVGFYNLDENTAVLRFQLSNSKGPLLVNENNLTAYAYFESSNGSASNVIELNVEDSFNGILTITLDKEFLQASTSTQVKGQVYIGVNNVDDKEENNEVAVFREFTFQVADALINKISSFTKIEYIRMFDQLKTQIEQRVNDIEKAIENGSDYVAEMKATKEQGIEQINQTVTESKKYIDDIVETAKTSIDATSSNAIDDVNTSKNEAINTLTNKLNETTSNIRSISDNTISHVDETLEQFNNAIEANEFLQHSDLVDELGSIQWQKYKITENNGNNILIDLENDLNKLHALTPGSYYSNNTPIEGVTNVNGFLKVECKDETIKRIEFKPYNSAQIWIKRFNNEWTDWERLDIVQTDTGWIPFTIINGGRTNKAYGYGGSRNGYGCSYRVVTTGNKIEKHVRVNADSIVDGQVIAQLPNNFTSSPQIAFIRAPKDHNGTSIILENTGELKVYVANVTQWTATSDKYIYGNMYWIE